MIYMCRFLEKKKEIAGMEIKSIKKINQYVPSFLSPTISDFFLQT